MKKVLCLLLLMGSCLFAGLEFVKAPDKVFNENLYYKGDEQESISYQEYYSSYVASKVGRTCNADIRKASSDFTVPVVSTNYAWFVPGEDKPSNSVYYTFSYGEEIIAPCEVEVVSSVSISNGGTEIELESTGGNFKFTITGLKCWWCSVDLDGYNVVHSSTHKGTVIPKGYLIGIATKETEITIYKGDTEISINDFYGGN